MAEPTNDRAQLRAQRIAQLTRDLLVRYDMTPETADLTARRVLEAQDHIESLIKEAMYCQHQLATADAAGARILFNDWKHHGIDNLASHFRESITEIGITLRVSHDRIEDIYRQHAPVTADRRPLPRRVHRAGDR